MFLVSLDAIGAQQVQARDAPDVAPLLHALAVGMSNFRSAPENGPGAVVGSGRCATGIGAASGRGRASLAGRCRFVVGSPEGCAFAASARKRRRSVRLFAFRGPGRVSLAGWGAFEVSAASTANKSLKYVPALRASTGRG